MALYRKVSIKMWGDAKFRALSQDAKFLWLYLLTGPDTTSLPGLVVGGVAHFSEAIGWKEDFFLAKFGEISDRGMAFSDWSARLIWIPNAIRYNSPQSPNVVRNWASHWSQIPECELKSIARSRLYEHMKTKRSKAFREAFREGFREGFREAFREASPKAFGKAKPKALPSGIQDQEQEQEQEQEQDFRVRLSAIDTCEVSPPPVTPVTTVAPDMLHDDKEPHGVWSSVGQDRLKLDIAQAILDWRTDNIRNGVSVMDPDLAFDAYFATWKTGNYSERFAKGGRLRLGLQSKLEAQRGWFSEEQVAQAIIDWESSLRWKGITPENVDRMFSGFLRVWKSNNRDRKAKPSEPAAPESLTGIGPISDSVAAKKSLRKFQVEQAIEDWKRANERNNIVVCDADKLFAGFLRKWNPDPALYSPSSHKPIEIPKPLTPEEKAAASRASAIYGAQMWRKAGDELALVKLLRQFQMTETEAGLETRHPDLLAGIEPRSEPKQTVGAAKRARQRRKTPDMPFEPPSSPCNASAVATRPLEALGILDAAEGTHSPSNGMS